MEYVANKEVQEGKTDNAYTIIKLDADVVVPDENVVRIYKYKKVFPNRGKSCILIHGKRMDESGIY